MIRGFGAEGKRGALDAAFAFPDGLVARARTLAAEEAKRAGFGVVQGVSGLRSAYTLSRERLADVAKSPIRYVGGPFFVVRDLPKAMSVGYELAVRGLFPTRETLRVLDLGAGFGTTTFGFARVAKALGLANALEVDAVDADPGVLERMRRLAAPDDELATITLRTHATRLESYLEDAGTYDLILVGLALNELAEDADRRFALLTRAITRLSPGGLLVIIEPALHATTRALMVQRDRLVAAGHAVVLPCTHANACPMLASGDRDWCHVELDLALPAEEASIADAVGLRDERLTFAPLVVATSKPTEPPRHRLVSRPLGSKGKTEAIVCGATGLVRLRELDREVVGEGIGAERRGGLLELDPAEPSRDALRLGRDARITRVIR